MIYDALIIGAGPVGLYGGFNLSILGINSLIVDANSKAGGQCSHLYQEKFIYDIPAFERIKAQDLINSLLIQQKKFQNKISYKYNVKIISIQKKDDIFLSKTQNNEIISSRTVILATGGGFFDPNRIPLNEAIEFENKSLFYQVNDILKFKNKEIVILGGGDSATDWCFELSNITKKIHLIHRRDNFRSINANIEKIKQLENIGKLTIFTPFKLTRINGENGFVKNIEIEDIEDQEKNKKIINCDFILAFFGIKNDNTLMKNSNIETKFNLIPVNIEDMSTNIEGIFAIGDSVNYKNKLKLIMTGFSESTIMSHSVYRFLFKKNPNFQHSTFVFN